MIPINKNRDEINFNDIFSEKQNDVLSFLVSLKIPGLDYMVDGIENIKTWGICDWVYIYNLNDQEIEVFYRKDDFLDERTLSKDPYIYLEECFDLVHTIKHSLTRTEEESKDSFNELDAIYNKIMNRN